MPDRPRIRTLIVDDEPLARERIAALLEEEPDIECVGECGDGRSAVATIVEKSPDLVFLDVQMPEMDGFAVLQALPVDRMPVVVFVTAFDRYALRAFDAHALDYLLKPFDRERFGDTLERVRAYLRGRAGGEIDQRLAALLDNLTPRSGYLQRFVIRQTNRIFFVKIDDVDWIEAAGNYLQIHAGKETHLVRETMHGIESRLDPAKFVRIHRSTIVAVERIKELRPWFHGEYVVILKDGAQLTLSRGFKDGLQRIIGEALK